MHVCANWQTGHQGEESQYYIVIIMETYYLRVLLAGLSVVSSMATALCIYYNQITSVTSIAHPIFPTLNASSPLYVATATVIL